jgi:hypothetical protein
MTASIKRLALSLGFTLALGFALPPLGCGSSGGGFGPAAPGRGDAEVPEGVALKLRTCAARHMDHLGSASHSVRFDVKLASDGEVDSVALQESTLGDEELEACMVSALRALSEDDLLMRRSDRSPRGPVAPESRALMGQVQALSCLSSPPCLLAVAFFIGAAYVAVEIIVHAAAQSSTAKPKPQTAPTATTMPIAVPTTDDEDDPCMPLMLECLGNKKQPAWNQKDFGPEKNCKDCYRECQFHSKPRGTWPDYKCPRN